MPDQSIQPALTWKDVFNAGLISYGHIDHAVRAAFIAGYRYVCWNNRVHALSENGQYATSTDLTNEDLDRIVQLPREASDATLFKEVENLQLFQLSMHSYGHPVNDPDGQEQGGCVIGKFIVARDFDDAVLVAKNSIGHPLKFHGDEDAEELMVTRVEIKNLVHVGCVAAMSSQVLLGLHRSLPVWLAETWPKLTDMVGVLADMPGESVQLVRELRDG